VKTQRHRFGVLILSIAASLGLMAISASATQAATWMVNGTNVTSKLSVGDTETPETDVTLLSKVLGQKFALLCEELEFRNAAFEASGVETGELFWKKCKVKLGEKEEESKACTPAEPIDFTEEGKGEKEEGKDEEEFKTTATIELPAECALFSGKLPVTGIWWLEDCENTWETEKETHLIQEAMKVALTLGGMKLEKEPAFIDGSILMKINDGGPKKFSALF
jgi:hypothetical protein